MYDGASETADIVDLQGVAWGGVRELIVRMAAVGAIGSREDGLGFQRPASFNQIEATGRRIATGHAAGREVDHQRTAVGDDGSSVEQRGVRGHVDGQFIAGVGDDQPGIEEVARTRGARAVRLDIDCERAAGGAIRKNRPFIDEVPGGVKHSRSGGCLTGKHAGDQAWRVDARVEEVDTRVAEEVNANGRPDSRHEELTAVQRVVQTSHQGAGPDDQAAIWGNDLGHHASRFVCLMTGLKSRSLCQKMSQHNTVCQWY